MKTELIYLWINKDPHGCFHQEGFNLSPKYHVSYSCDSDYVRDILRTAHIYSDDYFEGLVTQYPDLFKSKKEARDFVFFNYLEERDWGKRVLAKLTHDIAQKVSD